LKNNVNYTVFYHNFDSKFFKVMCVHTIGEVDNFYATFLSMNR